MGDLVNKTEKCLLEIPRGRDVLRVSHATAETPEGKPVSWHTIRLFWQDDSGTWKPGRVGITIRQRELQAVAAALSRASGLEDSHKVPETRPEPSSFEELGF